MSSKGEIYTIPLTLISGEELKNLVVTLNTIFIKIEDRLDELEALRGVGYFTTQKWEKNEVRE